MLLQASHAPRGFVVGTDVAAVVVKITSHQPEALTQTTTQRLQNPLIKDYTLDLIRVPIII